MLEIGIDEVGRGSIAGPLVVAAVALAAPVAGLKDSKALSRKRRYLLSREIRAQAEYLGLGWVSANELDSIGLSKALSLAASRALEKVAAEDIRFIQLDGNFNFLSDPYKAKVKLFIHGDASEPLISAASIIAKVARDEYMIAQAEIHPGYGFSSNVGYGTKEHFAAIKNLGVCPLHRQSFEPLKSMLLG